MSLNVPLAVLLGRRDITDEAGDLTFGWSDPGGFTSAQVSLDRPLSVQPAEIAPYGPLTVVDTRNGEVAYDGRLEPAGRSAGRSGQVYELAAAGGQAHTLDRTVPLIYVDKQIPNWTRLASTLQDVDTDPNRADVDTAPGWRIQVRQGSTISLIRGGVMGGVEYLPILAAGQKLARISLNYDMGVTDANWFLRLTFTSILGPLTVVAAIPWTTAGGSLARVVGTDWAAGKARPELTLFRQGSQVTVSDDTAYQMLTGIVVQATRFDASGTELLTGSSYTSNTVLASDVVADLLGRLLTAFDGANAVVTTTSYPIDHLIYPDGANANKVFADLMVLEPGYTWRAWERNSAGKFRFEWVPVPSSVRYEVDADEFDSQPTGDGLYNQVSVRYRGSTGAIATVTRTSTVPALDAVGLIRQGQIDLGDEPGSLANAQQAGDAWLADRQYPRNAGRVTISGPIFDYQTRRYVMPWEIRPGLIRVRGILPRVAALSATSRDGVGVFRTVSSRFRASDASATLELDAYVPTVARLIAGGPGFIGRPVPRPELPRRR